MTPHDDRLHAVLSTYQSSRTLRDGLAATSQSDVRAGQIWRARIKGTSLIVLTIDDFVDGSGDVVVATPGEVPPADSLIEHEHVATAVFRSLTLWPTVQGTLHHRVLDIMVEQSDTSATLANNLRSAPVQVDTHEDPLDPGSELIAELRDELARLQAAPAVPRRTSGDTHKALDLPGTGREQLELLMKCLDVNQHAAMELQRGRRTLSAEQARILEVATGMGPGILPSSAGVDPDLALEIEHPRWREAARRRAARTGKDEVAARVELAAEAYALAARESTKQPDWMQRIALLVAGEP